ncbi:hypothetical protein JTE90_010743 [Oedothorax gibbosus]|uniref:Uncharacterized protein n=1 Tax=Oedothorax gibbosus TaxID=931172 RepID=A0AAV6UE70_9ARAC|nr:hypothetical protein JTE90_010743 [Oedothorax gibbosus]
MNVIVSIFFVAVLVFSFTVNVNGHCADCTPEEFCYQIFWFVARCVRYRVQDDVCDFKRRVCDPDLICRMGTCQSPLSRTKHLSPSTSSTQEMGQSTTTKNIATTTTNQNLENNDSPSKSTITDSMPKVETTQSAKKVIETETTIATSLQNETIASSRETSPTMNLPTELPKKSSTKVVDIAEENKLDNH